MPSKSANQKISKKYEKQSLTWSFQKISEQNSILVLRSFSRHYAPHMYKLLSQEGQKSCIKFKK
jgi:hypothetical protein